MINASLREGRLPPSQKHTVISPLLKKPGTDADEWKNYRPVSNLTFMSELVERVVANRLVGYLDEHGLMPQLQSAYRRHHSTETALLNVMSDVYASVDRQQVTLLALLDLSAPFDCVDHDVLLRRLFTRFGIKGTALCWISSFLLGRPQRVYYKGQLSAILCLLYGVPQGSALRPILFLLYVSELFGIITECGFAGHAYADDMLVCISTSVSEHTDALRRYSDCIAQTRERLAYNRLKLNEDKTQGPYA